MKLRNTLVCGLVLTSLVGGTVTTLAQEYPSATKAKTTGEIMFKKDDDGGQPVDPTDPTDPVDPTDPINPNKGELMITYVSNFKFGEQEKSATSWNAEGDTMKNGKKMVPFVATKDARGTERKGWSLTAALSKGFADDKQNELKGAELNLSNMFYSDKVTGAPIATAGTVKLNNAPQEVASADAETGIGSWSLGLGELKDNKTNGVTLNVPSSSAKNTATYTAEVTWELTADATK